MSLIPPPSSKRACISTERMSSPFFKSAFGAPLGDLGIEQVIDLFQTTLELGPGPPAETARRQADQLRAGRGGLLEHVGQQRPQPLQPLPLGDAEDDAQDHLQRDCLHPRVDRELLADRPGVDLGVDDLLHDRLIGAHPLAMERRQHQFAVREVVGALQQQKRAGAENRLEDDVAAGRQAVPRLRVQRLDRLRVGDHHHRPLEAEELDAERVSVALPTLMHERQWPERPPQGLDQRRSSSAPGVAPPDRIAEGGRTGAPLARWLASA